MKEKIKFRGPVKYKFLYAYVSVLHRLFYRRLTVVGYEKIPHNTPVIFAPNHQNALMDALAVLFAARKPVVFMARADIFKKPFIARILNFLRILPIYRIRDGYGELGRNQEVFDDTVDVLKSNTPICILPEGNHEGLKRLRPLKKGIFRIAFQAEQSSEFNLNLHIIPIGIDYSDYFNAGGDLMLVFGTPIKIADYADQYLENEQRTIHTLVDVLSENIRSVMIHIPEEHYQLTYQVSEMYEPNVWNTCISDRRPYNKLTIRQYIIQKITEAFAQFPEKAIVLGDALNVYNIRLSASGIADCSLVEKQPGFMSLFSEVILTLLFLPIHIYGTILSFIPYKIPVWQASKMKDANFRSSVQFAISLFLFPVYYLAIILVFCLLTDGLLLKLVFALTLPLTGFFAFYNYKRMAKMWDKLLLIKFMLTKRDAYNDLLRERKQILDLIKTTINS